MFQKHAEVNPNSGGKLESKQTASSRHLYGEQVGMKASQAGNSSRRAGKRGKPFASPAARTSAVSRGLFHPISRLMVLLRACKAAACSGGSPYDFVIY